MHRQGRFGGLETLMATAALSFQGPQWQSTEEPPNSQYWGSRGPACGIDCLVVTVAVAPPDSTAVRV